mgnify:CR=1 FL=1
MGRLYRIFCYRPPVIRTEVARARVRTLAIPLKRPFVTALGLRTRTVNVGLTLRLKGGAEGYGEASTSLAMKNLSPAALRRALERLCARALGRDARDWRRLIDDAWTRAAHPVLPRSIHE